MFDEHCKFVFQILKEKMDISSNDNEDVSGRKYSNILQTYCFFWNQFSSSVIGIDQQFSKINKLVNDIYSSVEKDDDIEEDP